MTKINQKLLENKGMNVYREKMIDTDHNFNDF